MHHPTDRITHTTAFVTPVVEHYNQSELVPLKLTLLFSPLCCNKAIPCICVESTTSPSVPVGNQKSIPVYQYTYFYLLFTQSLAPISQSFSFELGLHKNPFHQSIHLFISLKHLTKIKTIIYIYIYINK